MEPANWLLLGVCQCSSVHRFQTTLEVINSNNTSDFNLRSMLPLITKAPQNNFLAGALYKRHLIIIVYVYIYMYVCMCIYM